MDISSCLIEIYAPCYSCGGTGEIAKTFKSPLSEVYPKVCATCGGSGKAPMKLPVSTIVEEIVDMMDKRYRKKRNGK